MGANHVCKRSPGKEICRATERGGTEQLHALIRKEKSSAQRLMKARILLKADVSEGGEGWSDSQIIEMLETSASTVFRTRQQLVEEGLEAVLSRKKPWRPSVLPIFDGEKEAKLIALACSEPPEGRAPGACGCWRTRLWNSILSGVPATARSAAF
jgi:hypothetical protein